ncbi:MAG: hypothetical protein ACI9LD_001004 [Polaromonas sp.]|jgi:hypothetical protein
MIVYLKSNYHLWIVTILLMSSAAQAATWFVLEAPESVSGITVEVNLESLRSRGDKRDVMMRISYPQAQKRQDVSFQSVIAELEISCKNDLDIWKSVSYFESSHAKGVPLSSENFGIAGMPKSVLKILPDEVCGTLQRGACGRNTTLFP